MPPPSAVALVESHEPIVRQMARPVIDVARELEDPLDRRAHDLLVERSIAPPTGIGPSSITALIALRPVATQL